MREDFRESLEKMFPNGYIVLYPSNNAKVLRLAYYILEDDGKPATDQLKAAYNLIKNDENSGEEWKV